MRITGQQALEILEVQVPNPSEEDIRQAYRRQSLRWHPDKHPQERRDEATARFQQITAAHAVLTGQGGHVREVPDTHEEYYEVDIVDLFAEVFMQSMGGFGPRFGLFGGFGGHVRGFGSGFGQRNNNYYYENEWEESDDDGPFLQSMFGSPQAAQGRQQEMQRTDNQEQCAWLQQFKLCYASNITKSSVTVDVEPASEIFNNRELPHGYFWELNYKPAAGGIAHTVTVRNAFERTVNRLDPGTEYVFRARPVVHHHQNGAIGSGLWSEEIRVKTSRH